MPRTSYNPPMPPPHLPKRATGNKFWLPYNAEPIPQFLQEPAEPYRPNYGNIAGCMLCMVSSTLVGAIIGWLLH